MRMLYRNCVLTRPGYLRTIHVTGRQIVRCVSNQRMEIIKGTCEKMLTVDCLDDNLQVPAVWFRHHCQCEQCYNSKTYQRMRIPSHLPDASIVTNTAVNATLNQLVISWNDNHTSKFDINWLKKNIPKQENSANVDYYNGFTYNLDYFVGSDSKTMQNSSNTSNPLEHAIPHNEFMREGNEGVAHLLSNILLNGYGIVSECPPDFESTKKVILKVSHPQNTIYGDFSEWTSNLAHADTAYTSDFVHLHTDTTYFSEPIGLQIFHCLKHEGSGGENLLVDGFKTARQIGQENQNFYQILSKVSISSQYVDPGKHHFHSNDVTFNHDRVSRKIQRIRYNPHDMAVLKDISLESAGDFYKSLIYLSDLLESQPQKLKLIPGIVIFLDNWRTLHGRTAFTGFRQLCGAYISRSDWLSRARTLNLY